MSFCTNCGTAVTVGALYCAACGTAVEDQSNAPTQQLRRRSSKGRRPSKESIAIGERRLLETLRSVTLGEYEILGELGRGGMAVVYLAHDIALDRKVAIKVMSPALLLMDAGVQDRFKREARTAAGLSHPHIIPVFAVKESEQIVYFVMKYVAGRSLESVIRELGPMPIPMVRTILSQTGAALAYAHRKGVVHRDVKPANILLDDEGWVVVTDFGIAKVSEAKALTMTGGVVGTPAYMSPEQCSGQEITGAADQYSLGVAAFEMLTGRQPFKSGTMVNLMYDHCHTAPPSVLDHRPDCPPDIADAVRRMLEKTPARRYPSVEDAVTAIGAVSDSQSGAVRTQILTLAQAGASAKLLEQFRTPGSPVPGRASAPDAVAPTERLAAEPAATPNTGRTSAPRARRRSRIVLLVLLALALPAAVVAWVLLARTEPLGDPVGGSASAAEPVTGPLTTAPAPPAASLTVAPEGMALEVGDSASAIAIALSHDGSPLDAPGIFWESSDPQVATVDSAGTVVAADIGTARIAARIDTMTATLNVRVTAPRDGRASSTVSPPVRQAVATVTVVPGTVTLSRGQTVSLHSQLFDARGGTVADRGVTWTSSDLAVATVDDGGAVTARAEGSARIIATVEGRSSMATVTVVPEPVAAVTVAPARQTLAVGDTAQLSTRITGSGGGALVRPVQWQSSDPTIAAVTSEGVVRARAPGTATVTARAGERSGQAAITVQATTPQPPAGPTRAEVVALLDARLEAYRRSLEAEDIAAVRRAYPGLTPEQERSWRAFFQSAEEVRVTFTIGERTIGDAVATARVEARLVFRASGRQDQTSQFTASFERSGADWRLVRVE